jgi:acetyl-CoA carboxylase carboxyl transferase subunit alpha
MKVTFLDFEQPIAELEAKIEELSEVQNDPALDISEEIERLRKKSAALTKQIYGKLNAWQISRWRAIRSGPIRWITSRGCSPNSRNCTAIARSPTIPPSSGGLARFQGEPVVVIGHQKGRDTKERQYRNFGMPRPEGYRKALRLMRLAEKFRLPVFTFIDTPGAYPGIDAEERGQSEAIARNLYVMAELKTPMICTVIGEGGSGGALAIGVGDALIMLQYATYSVISPEGCASILWKSAEKASVAAEALGITAPKLKSLGLIDQIVSEPLGGAHRDPDAIMESLRGVLADVLANVRERPLNALLNARYARLMGYGKFKEGRV